MMMWNLIMERRKRRCGKDGRKGEVRRVLEGEGKEEKERCGEDCGNVWRDRDGEERERDGSNKV